jgi:hypothetical protein
MLRHSHRPPRRPAAKAITQAVARQQLSEARIRQFDKACAIGYGVLALFVVAHLLVATVTGTPPVAQVGDKLEFKSGQLSLAAQNTVLPARVVTTPWRIATRACAWDVSDMAKTGGETTVTAVQANGVLLSWSGGATAPGSADCAGTPKIWMKNADYQRLLALQLPGVTKSVL